MKVLVTGSSGHLGRALKLTLVERDYEVVGIDLLPDPLTDYVGNIADRDFVKSLMSENDDFDVILHTATLHKPHVATHSKHQFVETNILGTLNLLEECPEGLSAFVFTSTTSTFGLANSPPPGEPAAWITEEVKPIPKNVYGVTKTAAEDMLQLFAQDKKIPSVVLRTSRFFPEEDDDPARCDAFPEDNNLKVNELLHRRADVEDIVEAHIKAMHKAKELSFAKYIISATTPFRREDAELLSTSAEKAAAKRVPEYQELFEKKGWKMFSTIDRVYDNSKARRELAWEPKYSFQHACALLDAGKDYASPLTRRIGSRGYHSSTGNT